MVTCILHNVWLEEGLLSIDKMTMVELIYITQADLVMYLLFLCSKNWGRCSNQETNMEELPEVLQEQGLIQWRPVILKT